MVPFVRYKFVLLEAIVTTLIVHIYFNSGIEDFWGNLVVVLVAFIFGGTASWVKLIWVKSRFSYVLSMVSGSFVGSVYGLTSLFIHTRNIQTIVTDLPWFGVSTLVVNPAISLCVAITLIPLFYSLAEREWGIQPWPRQVKWEYCPSASILITLLVLSGACILVVLHLQFLGRNLEGLGATFAALSICFHLVVFPVISLCVSIIFTALFSFFSQKGG